MPGRHQAPERYLTTVPMTDIVGSTAHPVESGDRACRDRLQVHHTLVRGRLRERRGREVDMVVSDQMWVQ